MSMAPQPTFLTEQPQQPGIGQDLLSLLSNLSGFSTLQDFMEARSPLNPDRASKGQGLLSLMAAMLPAAIMPQIYAGPTALGYRQAPNKFSSLADKGTRFEISDTGATIIPKSGAALNRLRNETPIDQIKVGDVLSHQELFNNYPELKNIYLDPFVKSNAAPQGSYSPKSIGGNPRIVATAPNTNSLIDVILHELQHAIQKKEDFAFGENAARNKRDYFRSAGEIEAHDVAARRNLSPLQRSQTQPYASTEIPLLDWLVKFWNKDYGRAMPKR